MPEKLKPCPACGDPYPRMVEHETFAYVACDTIGCCLSGPLAETEEGAARKWNTLARYPRPLRWTNEPPKEPGWYWIRDYGKRLHIVDVGCDMTEYEPQPYREWAGPIPEPKK